MKIKLKGNSMRALGFLAVFFICIGIAKRILALVAERKEKNEGKS